MKVDYLKEKKELISFVLLGVSAFLAVLILVKVTGFFTTSAKAEGLVKRAVAQNNTDTKDMDKYFAKYKALADELKKNNLFAPPPPKQHPVKEVLGILGDEVLIKDKWYKVGDTVGDAKVVAIGPTEATIEWDGKEKTFAPIDAAGPSQPGGPKTPRAVAKRGNAGGGHAQMVAVGPQKRIYGGTGTFGNLSDKERSKFQLKAEQKQRLLTEKEKFKKLLKSDAEQKKRLLTEKEKFKKLLKSDTKNIVAKQKKDMAQKTKRNGDSKPKKEGTQGNIKKLSAK
jgi:hypothetical protein